jgi:hypothetical protein
MKLLISEILQKVSNAKTKPEKVKILKENNSPALRAVLIANFDESIVAELPDGDVPYTPNDAPEETEHTTLHQEYRKLFYFFKGGAPQLQQNKREMMFIQLLENLHAKEAELICLVKDKKISKRWKITKQCVEEAFPQIVWGGRS